MWPQFLAKAYSFTAILTIFVEVLDTSEELEVKLSADYLYFTSNNIYQTP